MKLLTNVIFLKRIKKTKGNPKEDYTDKETPPNVYHIDTMEGMFRTLSKLMNENPKRDVLYLILLDEAQNFFNSYESQSPMSKELQKWFGTLRKFDACLWMMTPSIRNVPPKGRSFNDDPSNSGYLNGIFSKERMTTESDMRINGIQGNPRDWVKLQVSYDDKIRRYLKVPYTPWNRPYEELEVGEFGYDHLASADFTMGSEIFDFGALVTKISNTASLWMADVMKQFFEEMDKLSSEEPKESVPFAKSFDAYCLMKRMDHFNVDQTVQANYFGMHRTTFLDRRKAVFQQFGDVDVPIIVNTQSKKKDGASPK